MENKKKKRYGIIAALLLLVLAAGVGTYAWLSATQTKVNEFTVGSIGKPEVKPDPVQPDKPGTVPTDPPQWMAICSRPNGPITPR